MSVTQMPLSKVPKIKGKPMSGERKVHSSLR